MPKKPSKSRVKRKPVRRKKNDGMDKDKWGKIIKAYNIDGCEHRTGNATNMKVHKANNGSS